MPKLNKAQAKTVGDAESSSFEPLDDGAYHARLRDVKVSDQPGPSGSYYWKTEFEVVEDPYKNRRLWSNLSLSDAAAFKVKEFFDAFGEDTDTDTDELIGQVVKLIVSQTTIQAGARKGEIGNQIDRIAPAADDFEAAEKEESAESLI